MRGSWESGSWGKYRPTSTIFAWEVELKLLESRPVSRKYILRLKQPNSTTMTASAESCLISVFIFTTAPLR